jgi:3-(3-hydroxy-phenyl)propionate hydroxylase
MLMATAADPARARAFIRERAMIDCVRDSLAVA